jgi:hypothetical protein
MLAPGAVVLGRLLHPEREADGMVVQADHDAVGQQPPRSLLLLPGQAGGVGWHPPELGCQLEAAEVLSRGEIGVGGVAARSAGAGRCSRRVSHQRSPAPRGPVIGSVHPPHRVAERRQHAVRRSAIPGCHTRNRRQGHPITGPPGLAALSQRTSGPPDGARFKRCAPRDATALSGGSDRAEAAESRAAYVEAWTIACWVPAAARCRLFAWER